MCLTCIQSNPKNSSVSSPKKTLRWGQNLENRFDAYLCQLNGEKIPVTDEMHDEICNHAEAIVATGVDTQFGIWAIQWPHDYKVKTF